MESEEFADSRSTDLSSSDQEPLLPVRRRGRGIGTRPARTATPAGPGPGEAAAWELERRTKDKVVSSDVEQLCTSYFKLADHIAEGDGELIKSLTRGDVVQNITKLMKEYLSNSLFQQAACEVLIQCSLHPDLRPLLKDHSIPFHIREAMKAHRSDPYLVAKAVNLLSSIAESGTMDTELRKSTMYVSVLAVLKAHMYDVAVQKGGLQALTALLRNDKYAQLTVVYKGHYEAILQVLWTHTDNAEVFSSGLQVLKFIAGTEKGILCLMEKEILSLITAASRQFRDDASIMQTTCELIDIIASHGYWSYGAKLVEHNAIRVLESASEGFTEFAEIQASSLSAMDNILSFVAALAAANSTIAADRFLEESLLRQTNANLWLVLIHDALQNHQGEPRLQETACRCLARLLETFPHLHQCIGMPAHDHAQSDGSGDEEDISTECILPQTIPLHNAVWLSFLVNRSDPLVFQAACLVVYFMVVENESLQAQLIEKGAGVAILDGLREHMTEPLCDKMCVEFGLRALLGLTITSTDAQKKYMEEIGIAQDLLSIMEKSFHDPEVMTEAFGITTCLHNIKKFWDVMLGQDIHSRVLSAMKEHHSHPLLVESCLELLIILSLDESVVPLLNDAETLCSIASIVKEHVIYSAIQSKGCLLIKRLFDEKKFADFQCDPIASLLVDALSRWKTDPEVLVEALLCAMHMCVHSAVMSLALVKEDVHLTLFEMLSKEEAQQREEENLKLEGFINTIGIDIIYHLSCARDFKQQMLLKAIKDGLLEGVKVLLGAGADVNKREGGGEGGGLLPICAAVQSEKTKVVEYLLTQGVNTAQEALPIARRTRQDIVTGLLLRHIGLDQNGDTVNLSGMELELIKPEWILPCLGVKLSVMCHRNSQQYLGHVQQGIVRRKSLGRSLLPANTESMDSGVNVDCLPGGNRTEKSHASRHVFRRKSMPILNVHTTTGAASVHEQHSSNASVKIDQSVPGVVPLSHVLTSPSPLPSSAQQRRPRPNKATKQQDGVFQYSPTLMPISGSPRIARRGRRGRRHVVTEDGDMGADCVDGGEETTNLPSSGQTDLQATLRSRSLSCSDEDSDGNESKEQSSLRRAPQRRHQKWTKTVTGTVDLPFGRPSDYQRQQTQDLEGEEEAQAAAMEEEGLSISPTLLLQHMWYQKTQKLPQTPMAWRLSVPGSPYPSRDPTPTVLLDTYTEEGRSEQSVSSDTQLDITGGAGGSVGSSGQRRRRSVHDRRSSSRCSSVDLSYLMRSRLSVDSSMASDWSDLDSDAASSALIRQMAGGGRGGGGGGGGTDEVDGGAMSNSLEDDSSMEESSSSTLVTSLDLSSNSLSDLFELACAGEKVYSRLRNLEKFDLKQNQLTSLPMEMFSHLKRLKFLNLSCNLFSIFPSEALYSCSLVELDLSGNRLSEVPEFDDLLILPNLVRLSLHGNDLTQFPCEFNGRRTPRLKHFNLSRNKIATIPDRDLYLRELEMLNLSHNRLEELPLQFLSGLHNLETLKVSRNGLKKIPGDAAEYLGRFKCLKAAYNSLGKNEIELNQFITTAPIIQSVDISDNGLTTLFPPYAWKSQGIKDLLLTSNKLAKLDLSDCGNYWPHLERLYLGSNRLKEVPREIGQLRTLSCLDLSNNRGMASLPDELGKLDMLFMLNVQGLNKALDPSLAKGSVQSLISYFKSRLTRSVPYHHMKMMVVGGAGKGKTTLLDLLIQSNKSVRHSSSRPNIATLGVSVQTWTYQQRQGVTYHVSCWDFAGQEEFYSTHQCFLTSRSLYLVLYNISRGTEELQSLLPWLLNLQARAPNSPIIIVGTHLDQVPAAERNDVRKKMRTHIHKVLCKPGFPPDVSYAEVSCFDEPQVHDLRRKIKELIDSAKLKGQKIMGALVPSNYLAVEEVILREAKRMAQNKSSFPVLTAGRLKLLMDEAKLTQRVEKVELDQAISFLHDSGVLLHFSDHQSNLSELFFLDPEWLCMLMAHIITVKEKMNFVSKEGLLHTKNIPHILREPRFPSEYTEEYIRLLERFEVALRQTEHTILIPSCLPKKNPASLTLPPAVPGSQIERRYSMCYIPPGFWPRLIARLILFPQRALKKQPPPNLQVSSEAVYSYWLKEAFYLVELLPTQENCVNITVPTTPLGTKLLCAVVDNMEALIDEWFPGLRGIDTRDGEDLISPLCLCPFCPATGPVHYFKLKELEQVSLREDEVTCPQHQGPVPLQLLAPDIVICDLHPNYKVTADEFSLNESSSKVLGKGGFGEVYKAVFRGKPVAVKVFLQKSAEMNGTTATHLLRQEVSILSQLEHPNIVRMVAVCSRPKPMLLLEFAELGSLGSLHPYTNINVALKHRIAMQVASALSFLHKASIIYRDLKADNVLLFSLSLLAKVNAKLSDYGIACYATESGLTQPMGTAGSRAPELLRASTSNTPYDEKVDIFSYGLLLFTLMTNGHRPFEELSVGYERDKAIKEGRPINDIEHYGCPPWPDMQDIINHCLQFLPGNRPTAQEVFDRLCGVDFLCLKRAIPVEHNCTVESFVYRNFEEKGRQSVEVWMVSNVGSQTMLSIINLTQAGSTPQGMIIPYRAKVFCLATIDASLVLMGTNTGSILVYDAYEKKLKHRLGQLTDCVLCLAHFKSNTEKAFFVCAGLANGQLALYDQYLLQTPNAQARVLNIGTDPICSIRRFKRHLFVCCGVEVVMVQIADFIEEMRWTAVKEELPHALLTCLEVGLGFLWTAHRGSPKVQLWDLRDKKLKATLHCDKMVESLTPSNTPSKKTNSLSSLKVTSMLLQPPPQNVLWVGLGSGHLLLVNANNRTPLMTVRRHMESIRRILSVKAFVSDKLVHFVLTGGFGFQQRPGVTAPSKGTPETYGNLLVWDSIMPRFKATYDEIKREQRAYR